MKSNMGKIVIFLKSCSILLSLVSISLSEKRQGNYVPRLDAVPGSISYQRNYITYFMYNITNVDEFEKGGVPAINQVGPYVYRETRKKYNVKKVSDSAVSYAVERYWEFAPELSEGHKETDSINVINIPMIILANKLSAKRLPKAFNDILVDELKENGESLVRRNEEIGKILYHGMNVSGYTEILADVLQGNVPPEFADGIFALLKGKNGSVEGTFTMGLGESNMGDILSFNNKSKLEYWGGDFCNKIEGTDGYFFRPGIKKDTTLKIFYPELCRSVHLKWTGEQEYEGIKVARFSFPEDLLEDAEAKPENSCFCSKPIIPTNDTKAGCLKKGFVDYASCKQESPLLVSFPHFLYADEEYRQKIIGMKPIPAKHETEFLVEPNTGTIVSGVRRFQFNIKLRPLDNVEAFRNVTFIIFPVFTVERKIIVPESRITRLKEDLKKLMETPIKKDKERSKISKLRESQTGTIEEDYAQDQPQPQAEPELTVVEEENNSYSQRDGRYKSADGVASDANQMSTSMAFNIISALFILCYIDFKISL